MTNPYFRDKNVENALKGSAASRLKAVGFDPQELWAEKKDEACARILKYLRDTR